MESWAAAGERCRWADGRMSMSPGIPRQTRRAFFGLGAAAIAVSLNGCSVTPAVTHWQRLNEAPSARVLADDRSAMRTIQPIDLQVNGRTTVRIDHSDPAIRSDGATSYVKLFRFQGESPGTYEVRVDAWCDCPWTAILWGTRSFPIFYPKVVVLDRAGNMLLVRGEVEHMDPAWTWTTTARIRGRWSVNLSETGPYYVLVTSQHIGPKFVGEMGGDIGQLLSSSPVGKIRISIKLVG